VPAVAYLLGYISRSLHAWERNLGPVRAVQLEHLVAGTLILIPVLAYIGVLYFGWYWFRKLVRREHASGHAERIPRVLWAVVIVGTFGLAALPRESPSFTTIVWVLSGFSIVLILYARASPEKPRQKQTDSAKSTTESRFDRLIFFIGTALFALWEYATLFAGVMLLLIFAVLAFCFGAKAIGYLPQEFAGAAPRCAILDVVSSDLSAEVGSLLQLRPSDQSNATATSRTRSVLVYSSGDQWLLRVPDKTQQDRWHSIALSGKAVQGAEWLGRRSSTAALATCPQEQ
jgi:hypothetical protein